MDAQLAERRERISVLNEQEKAQSAELDALRKQSVEQEQQRTQAEQALRQAEQAQRRQERTLHALELDRTAAESGLAGHERPQNDAGFRNRSSGTAAGIPKSRHRTISSGN